MAVARLVHRILELWFREDGCRFRRNWLRVRNGYWRRPTPSGVARPCGSPAYSPGSSGLLPDSDQLTSRAGPEYSGWLKASGARPRSRGEADRQADRIVCVAGWLAGELSITKTGQPPSAAQVAAGYALQLGYLA